MERSGIELHCALKSERHNPHTTPHPKCKSKEYKVKHMNIALILSGGTGLRLGSDTPKQYLQVGTKPIISYSFRTLSQHHLVDAIQIVADSPWQEPIRQWLKEADPEKKFKGFSLPGKNRQLSILHGLEGIKKYASSLDYVFIHDAARPLLSEKQITDCLSEVKGHDGLMPVLPMKDTVYSSRDGKTVSGLLNRSEIFAGQAPEVFRLGVYEAANRALLPDKILTINGSAEPAVMAGLDVVMIPGDEGNFKITTKADLERFRSLMHDE